MRWKYNLPDKFKYSGQGFWHGTVFGNTRLVAFPPPLVDRKQLIPSKSESLKPLKISPHIFFDVSKRRKIWEALKSSKFPPANTGAQPIWFKGQDPARPKESKGVSRGGVPGTCKTTVSPIYYRCRNHLDELRPVWNRATRLLCTPISTPTSGATKFRFGKGVVRDCTAQWRQRQCDVMRTCQGSGMVRVECVKTGEMQIHQLF